MESPGESHSLLISRDKAFLLFCGNVLVLRVQRANLVLLVGHRLDPHNLTHFVAGHLGLSDANHDPHWAASGSAQQDPQNHFHNYGTSFSIPRHQNYVKDAKSSTNS